MRALALALLLGGLGSLAAQAAEPVTVNMVIKDHKFTPSTLTVPANQKVVIQIDNQDPLAEEFESSALKIEKVIAGKSQGTVRLHPLDPGTYSFIGEYHSDTAQGVVIAK